MNSNSLSRSIPSQLTVCREEELYCVKEISVSTEECPGRCEGMMVGVRRDPVTRRQSQEFRRLVREYEDYKCRDYSDFPFNNYRAEGCIKQKFDFFLITMISQS